VRGVPRLPLREAQRVEGLGNARLRGVPCGPGCDTWCGANARGRTGACRRSRPHRREPSRAPRRVGGGAGRPGLCGARCAASCGAQCGACALGRRPRPLVAVWHARCVGRGGVRCEQHARAPPWPLRGPCRAPLRGGARSSATSALCRKGRGGILVTERSPPFFKELQTSTTTLLVWVGARGPSRGQPPPGGQIGGRATPADPRAVRAWGVEAGPPPLAPRIERDVVPRMGALGSVRDPRGRG
jgi:hypothetical protein